MIVHSDLHLVAFNRVRELPQRAVWPLLDLISSHLKEHGQLDRDAFLLLADEAEAIA